MLLKKKDSTVFESFSFPTSQSPATSLRQSFSQHISTHERHTAEISAEREAQIDEQFEQGFNEGKALGFLEGKKQGVIKGLELGQEKAMTHIEPIKTTLISTTNEMNSLRKQYKDLLRESALQLTKLVSTKVTEKELQLDDSIIKNWIEKAIYDLPETPSDIAVYLSKSDLAAITKHFTLELEHCTVKENHLLDSGQVDIRTDIVDIFIDARRKIDEMVEEYRHG